MIRLRSWLLICAREYKLLQSVCQVQLLENMLFHFQSNFTGAPLEFLQYNYFEELPFLKTYQQQTLKKANVFISSLKTLGAFSIEFIASVRAFQIEEEFFLSLSRRGEKPLEVQFRTQASLLGAECSSYPCVHLWLGFPVPPNIFQAWGYTRIRHHQRARESPAIIVALRSYPIRMQCLISTHIRE